MNEADGADLQTAGTDGADAQAAGADAAGQDAAEKDVPPPGAPPPGTAIIKAPVPREPPKATPRPFLEEICT